jgi:hypothetical protein
MSEPNQAEWQAPPPPEPPVVEDAPQMSEAGTLGNIFIEPGRTFEDLHRKPRFIFATIIICLLATGFQFAFMQKIGDEGFRRFMVEQIDKSPQAGSMTPEQKNDAINMQMTISKYSVFVIPVFIIIMFVIGGLIYWLAGNAMGGSATLLRGVSAWVYSSFPPSVIGLLGNFIVLFFKSADDIDIASSQRGVLHANPSMFIDGKEMPVLATLLGTIDVFQIWGWILAAIGLQKLAKISSGSSWTIVFILALISVAFKVIFAYISGNPM